MESIILASSSPRRKELLEDLGIPFQVVHPDIDESVFDNLPPSKRVVELATAKAQASLRRLDKLSGFEGPTPQPLPRLLLAADTLVASHSDAGSWNTEGKPGSREEAFFMLRRLAGKTHTVFSGICLADRFSGVLRTRLSETEVTFANLDDDEIRRYVATDEWAGAAGGYRLQGKGSLIIERICGSWSGVVGLPLRELYGILTEAKYSIA